MKRIYIAVAVGVLLNSCSTYKSFKTPDVSVENICGEDIQMQDSLAQIPSWREMFADPKLQTLIDSGLTSNTDLQTALLNIEQTEALFQSSRLAFLPSLSFAPQGGVSKVENASSTQTYSLPLTTQWEIDLSGKLRNSKEQARSSVLKSKEYAKYVQTKLVASIANSYYTLIKLDKQLELTQKSIANQKENLEVIKELKKAGMQTEAAVNQATANYFSVQASAKDLEKQIAVVENSMALLLNETPHSVLRNSFPDSKLLDVELKDSISVIALSNRPDVKQAEYALRNNFYGINVARAAFYPSLTLSGNAGWTNNLGTIVNPGKLLLSATGALTQPIFNRGVNKANLKIAKAQYQQSLLSFQKALLTAGNEVNSALIACQNSEEKLALRDQQIEANEKAWENSKELMKHSSNTYLEVLTAQSTLLQSELTQVSDWFEGVQGRIDLYKALGGGVE